MQRKPGAGRKQTKEPVSLEAARLGARIRARRRELSLSLKSVAKRLKISHQALSNIETGQADPDDSRTHRTIQRLADVYQDNFGLSGVAVQRRIEIPIVAKVAAGKPIVETDEGVITIDTDFIHLIGDECGLRVSGESMVNEHILDGDVLICHRASPDDVPKGKIVVIDLKGERGAAVKRFQREQGMIYLYSDKYATDEDKMKFHDWEAGKIFQIIGLIRRVY